MKIAGLLKAIALQFVAFIFDVITYAGIVLPLYVLPTFIYLKTSGN
jgi:hypothetical protein